jgi:hypothetical protein
MKQSHVFESNSIILSSKSLAVPTDIFFEIIELHSAGINSMRLPDKMEEKK